MNFSHFASSVTPPATVNQPALWFIIQGERLLVQPAGETFAVPRCVDPAKLGVTLLRSHYLGHAPNGDGEGSAARLHCYAAEIAADAPLPDGLVAEALRPLYPGLGEPWWGLAGRALQIIEWDRTHQYCGRCGAATEQMPTERARRCPVCGLTNYPRLAPAVIVAVVRHSDAAATLLLARNHRFPAGFYSVVAGFVEPGESLEECVHREVAEEVGVQVSNLRYFGSQPWPFPHSLMVGFTAEYAGGDIALEEAEIADAQWFAAGNLPLLPPKMSIARQLIDWFVAESENGKL
jgi:NAD+ diphosphatase